MGVKLGASGYQSQASAELAGKQALERFLVEIARGTEKMAASARVRFGLVKSTAPSSAP